MIKANARYIVFRVLPQSWWVIIGVFLLATVEARQGESKGHQGMVAWSGIPALLPSPS